MSNTKVMMLLIVALVLGLLLGGVMSAVAGDTVVRGDVDCGLADCPLPSGDCGYGQGAGPVGGCPAPGMGYGAGAGQGAGCPCGL